MAEKQSVSFTVPTEEALREGAESSKVLTLVKGLCLNGPSEYMFAARAICEIAAKHDEIDSKRTSITKPLLTAKKAVDDLFGPALKPLKEAEKLLREKLGEFVDRVESERSTLLGTVASSNEREQVLARAHELEVPSVEGVSVSVEWTGGVVDEAAIPREFMIPDIKALEKATQAAGCDPGIPGWEASPRSTLRVSRKAA